MTNKESLIEKIRKSILGDNTISKNEQEKYSVIELEKLTESELSSIMYGTNSN